MTSGEFSEWLNYHLDTVHAGRPRFRQLRNRAGLRSDWLRFLEPVPAPAGVEWTNLIASGHIPEPELSNTGAALRQWWAERYGKKLAPAPAVAPVESKPEALPADVYCDGCRGSGIVDCRAGRRQPYATACPDCEAGQNAHRRLRLRFCDEADNRCDSQPAIPSQENAGNAGGGF